MLSLRAIAASFLITAVAAADPWTGTGQIGVQKAPYGYMGCLDVDGHWIILNEGAPDTCGEYAVTAGDDGTFTIASTDSTPCVIDSGKLSCAEGLTATPLSADGEMLVNPDAEGTKFYTSKSLPVGSVQFLEVLTASSSYEIQLQWYGK